MAAKGHSVKRLVGVVLIFCVAFAAWMNNTLPTGPFMLPFGWRPPISVDYFYHLGWPFTFEQWMDADKNVNKFALVLDLAVWVGVIIAVLFVARKVIRFMRVQKKGVSTDV